MHTKTAHGFITKCFFNLQNRHTKNRTSNALHDALQTGPNMRTRWKDSTFFTFKTNLALQRWWRSVFSMC